LHETHPHILSPGECVYSFYLAMDMLWLLTLGQ